MEFWDAVGAAIVLGVVMAIAGVIFGVVIMHIVIIRAFWDSWK